MKDFLLKNIIKSKKRLALFLAVVITVSCIGDLGFVKNKKTVHAGVTDKVIFAEGYGTGKDFSSSSWKFAGQALNSGNSGTYDISTHPNGPKIVNNDHTSEQEKIIRLINGVKVGDVNGNEADSSYTDYRSGEAFLSNGIKFSSDSAFSMKFTFSMPDAVVNTTDKGTHGEQYAREVGGDGIAFVMTTNENHNTQAGSGIGYQNKNDSIAIEMDSFFNGAYCDMTSGSGTAYQNWGFDNQVYFHKKWQLNGSKDYSDVNNPYGNDPNEDDIDYVPYRNYKFAERFDHIGITLNGNVKKHEAIAYINGLDPIERETHNPNGDTYYTFKNLAYFGGNTVGKDNIGKYWEFDPIYNASPKKSSIQEDTTNTCSTRFTDKNVNNRLFTVWVDYDGTKMYVRYANGNFKTAVRPNKPIIEKTINMDNFDGRTVYMGFTSAVGSSKANHTIHSFYFTNEFLNDDIKTKYTEEYYVETPHATSNFILMDGKRYVKKHDNVKEGIKLDSTVKITDMSSDTMFAGYEEVDYSSDPLYPKKTKVKPDGTTVLYQFFDLKPTYTCEYYLEVNEDTEGAEPFNGKYFKLEASVKNSEKTGEFINSEYDNSDIANGYYWTALKGSSQIANTKKRFTNYKPDYNSTILANAFKGYVAKDDSLVLKFYYSKIITKYTEKYYVEDDTATTDFITIGTKKYKLQTPHTNVVNNAVAGSEVKINDLSKTVFADYKLLSGHTDYPSTGVVAEDGGLVLYQIYEIIPKAEYNYKVEYYKEVSEAEKDEHSKYHDGKWYKIDDAETESKSALDGTKVEVAVNANGAGVKADNVEVDGTFKKFDGYGYNSTITTDNGQSSGTVSATELTIQLFFDKTTTKYEAKYYLEIEDQTSNDFDVEIFDDFGIKVKYKLDTEKSYTDSNVAKGSSATINNESEYYKEKYNDKYELLPATNDHPYHVDVIADNGTTTVYQIYRLKPKYTVKYYLEVPKDKSGAIEVDVNGTNKYYELQSAETVTKFTKVDAVVNVINRDGNKEAGIAEAGTSVEDTMKSFEKYEYSSATTQANGKYANLFDNWNTEYVFEIFYDKKTTKYTEVYLVEMKNQSSPVCDAKIDNVLYERLEADVEVTGKDIDSDASITDKSTNPLYVGYKLMTTSPEGYPSYVGKIEDDGTTKVYQVYTLPEYQVKYYTQIFEDKADAVEVNGKYYELRDTVTNKATAGTVVEYFKKTDAIAGVKEGTKENDSTFKGYDKYVFSEDSTVNNPKHNSSITVSKTENKVVELFYDAEPTKYTMKYLIEIEEDDIKPGDKIEEIGETTYKVNESKEVTNLPLNADAKIENKSDKDPYVNYDLQAPTKDYPSEVEDIADDGTTVVYQIYNIKPEYTVNYWVEVKPGEPYDREVDGKYYVIKSGESITNQTSTGTKVEYGTDGDKAGVKENASKIIETFKDFIKDGFKFSDDSTKENGKISGTASRLTELIIDLFFDKNRTKYTEMYLVEVVNPQDGDVIKNIDGVNYKVQETNEVSNVRVDSSAKITNKSNVSPYTGYELIEPPTGYPSEVGDIDDKGNTIVYQVYRLHPNYTVKYYKEVLANTEGAVYLEGINKYYVLQEADTVIIKAPTDTIVEYVKKDDVTAGVKEGTVEKTETLKSYEKYKFSADATVERGNIKSTVSRDTENVIELFYNIKRTSYTEKYLIETVNPKPEDVVVDIDGVKYIEVESKENPNVPIGIKVEIEDKSGLPPYTGYDLVAPTPSKPSVIEKIKEGENIVYQVYNLPSYTVEYYTEVLSDTEGAKKVGEKYYVQQKLDTKTFKAPYATEVEYVKKDNETAGVKEGTVEKAETLKSYEKYAFSADATVAHGKSKTAVTKGGENIVRLFYDMKRTSYTEKYLIETVNPKPEDVVVDIDGVKYIELESKENPNVPIGIKVEIEDKSGLPPYTGYDLVAPTPSKPSVIEKIKEGENIVYQVYNLPSYTVMYYTEVSADTEGAKKVGEKYYVLQKLDTKTFKAPYGTNLSYVQEDEDTAVVKEGDTKVTNTSKKYDNYKFSKSSTETRGNYAISLSKEKNVIELFYDVKTTYYTMKYLIEVEDKDIVSSDVIETIGKTKYKVNETKEVTNLPLNADAKIENKSDKDPYVNYELQNSTVKYPSEVKDIEDDGTTVVYQIYNLKPKYVVNYYVEVKPGEPFDIEADGKYYIIKSEESITNETSTGTNVEYGTDGNKAGVKENASKIIETFKEFLGFTFSDTSTKENGNVGGTASRLTDLIIDLLFNKNRTEYTEMYLVEVVTPKDGEKIINIDGVNYKVQETNKVSNVTIDSGAKITDKSTVSPYTGYDLIASPKGYPSEVKDIDDKGNTIVYQVYNLPSYTVEYYKEVLENTEGAKKVGEKYYVQQKLDTVTFKAPYATEVEYVKKDDVTAGVKEGTVEKTETLKSYEKYAFSGDATVAHGKSKIAVTKGGENLVRLFYDMKRTSYTEKYLIETVDPKPDDVVVDIDGVIYIEVESKDIPDIPIGTKVEITDKSELPPYTGYDLVAPTPSKPSVIEKIEEGENIVYQVYNLPSYTVEYYKEVLENTEGAKKVGEKYYVLQQTDTVTFKAPYATEVEYVKKDNETAGVKEGIVEKAETLKSYEKYAFSGDATVAHGKSKIVVTKGGENLVRLFYDMKRTSYTEKYLIETVDPKPDDVVVDIDGVIYIEVESKDIPDIPIGTKVEITDKSELPPYTGYDLVAPTPSKPSVIEKIEEGENIVYQVYNLPSYTVMYYTEVSADTEGAKKVGENKYYVLQSQDTMTIKAPYKTVVSFVKTDDKTAGVKEGDVNVEASLKNYEEYKFSEESTNTNKKATGTLENGTDLVIELFYDKIITEYKEKYWVEDPNATENYVEIEINGEVKKFVLSETNDVTNVKPGGNIDVTDKSEDYLGSEDYENYELVDVVIPNYPSSDSIKEDGSTVVHQIYVLKPTYEVQYYVEVEDKTDNAIEVDGKYYVIKSEESITKYASTNTNVTYATKADKAGVKEDDVEITNTFKMFDGYTFSQKATDTNGNVSGKVTHDNNVVIMLMYDLVVIPEEPTTEPPKPEEPTTPEETTTEKPTKPSKPVETGDNVNSTFMVLILCSGFVVVMLMAGKKKSEN